MKRLYKDRDWLYDQYWGKKKNIKTIAQEIHAGRPTIRKYLKKFNIPKRNIYEIVHLATNHNHVDLSSEAIEFLNGEMLGDGSIQSQSHSSAYFSYGSQHKEYIEWLQSQLEIYGIQCGALYSRIHKTSKHILYFYQSKYYGELLSWRKKWYPNGKKIVPEDIELTPLTCRQWYIGDGYLANKKHAGIRIATCGFSPKNVEYLVGKLNQMGFKTTRHLACNAVYIHRKSIFQFLNFIGYCPVQCYEYKWDVK